MELNSSPKTHRLSRISHLGNWVSSNPRGLSKLRMACVVAVTDFLDDGEMSFSQEVHGGAPDPTELFPAAWPSL